MSSGMLQASGASREAAGISGFVPGPCQLGMWRQQPMIEPKSISLCGIVSLIVLPWAGNLVA